MIKSEDVKYIASLSRIHLREEEIQFLTKDLESILDYIKKLDELNTDAIKPTSHVLSLKNVFRSDNVRPSLDPRKALSFAIQKHETSFKVPKVIE